MICLLDERAACHDLKNNIQTEIKANKAEIIAKLEGVTFDNL
jgi:hypothetical protein